MLGAAIVGASVCHRVALLFVHVSFAHTVKATQPLFVLCLARAAGLAPRLNARARLGLLLAILGVGLSARTEFAFDWRGLLAAEASALAIAVGSVGQKRALLAAPPGRDGGGAGGADAGAGASALSTQDVFFLTNACGTLLLLPYWLLFEARVLRTADAAIARARRAQRARDGRAALRLALGARAHVARLALARQPLQARRRHRRVRRRLSQPRLAGSARAKAARASAGVACYSRVARARRGARARTTAPRCSRAGKTRAGRRCKREKRTVSSSSRS